MSVCKEDFCGRHNKRFRMGTPCPECGLTPAQVGILRDVAANKIDLNTCGEWLRDQLVGLVLNDGGPDLIDTLGPSVVLTEAGRVALAKI